MTDLSNPIFHDEAKAREYLEAVRWPDGPFCPHCGETENTRRMKGKSHRPGLFQCNSCRGAFSVTVGTLYERSKVPLHKWLMATHLLCASKKGMSSHQLHRMLGVTYKTAWFMTHRIREAMREKHTEPMGGEGKAVQADETFIGKTHYRKGEVGKRGYGDKEKVFTLVEGGKARSFHVPRVNAKTLKPILREQIRRDSTIFTDEAAQYTGLRKEFDNHLTVNHGVKEYVRGGVTTNACENYFSILKRGLVGVYQHVSPKHLKRYTGEFDFRYNTRGVEDHERAALALKGIWGKRLTYRRTGDGANV